MSSPTHVVGRPVASAQAAAAPILQRVLAAAGMFVVAFSFLFTTSNVGESAPFLLKDLTLLGAALWTAGEAFAVGNRASRQAGA